MKLIIEIINAILTLLHGKKKEKTLKSSTEFQEEVQSREPTPEPEPEKP